MSDNQYREVGPYEVAVSDMNERRSSPVTNSIQKSIEQQGVIQPPLVRERDDVDSAEVPYEAVVGQRRVLGAQATAGEKSPVEHGQARSAGLSPEALANSRTMQRNDSEANQPIDRDESTDDRPQLVAHDVSNVHDGPLVAFYDPEGETLGGEIIYARATVNVGDWR